VYSDSSNRFAEWPTEMSSNDINFRTAPELVPQLRVDVPKRAVHFSATPQDTARAAGSSRNISPMVQRTAALKRQSASATKAPVERDVRIRRYEFDQEFLFVILRR
jgi:hypothetical protein